MANVNKPSGLTPLYSLLGGGSPTQANVYYIPSANGSAFAIGDPVATGPAADANGVPGIVLATAGGANLVRGVCIGFGISETLMANPGNLDTTVVPATKTRDYYALVIDDPYTVFEIQEVNSGTFLTAAEVGLNTSLVSGTNNGFVSGWTLDNATEAGTATLQLKILGLSRIPDNTYGQFAKWKVLINAHEFKAGTAGA